MEISTWSYQTLSDSPDFLSDSPTWCGPSKSNKVGWVIDHWGELRIQVREQVLDAADGGDHKLLSSALAKKTTSRGTQTEKLSMLCIVYILQVFIACII